MRVHLPSIVRQLTVLRFSVTLAVHQQQRQVVEAMVGITTRLAQERMDQRLIIQSTQIAANYQMVGTAQSIHANNSLVASRTTVANTANIGRLATYLGQTAGGSMSEVIIYNTDKSTDRSDIFTNMMDHYSIT